MPSIDAHILVVDDDEDILTSARLLLKQFFRQVDTLSSPTNIIPYLNEHSVDLVLLDMNFRRHENEGTEGLNWLQRIKNYDPAIQVIPMTAFAEIELAVTAVKKGAYDFIIKPWINDKLIATLSAALQLRQSQHEIDLLKQQRSQLLADIEADFEAFIGESAPIVALKDTLSRVAKTDANVLITGENGTGKEVLARQIHRLSLRENGPFIPVDIGAVAESLFESELFGYKKGAFTDAKMDKPGRFTLAQGGTLFLDEIGNLPLGSQAKLLGALQNKLITPLGSTKTQKIDVRIIAATNANLSTAIAEKSFRTDLFYRINTVELHLPPLRDRSSDIPLLAQHFLRLYATKYQKPGVKMNKDDMELLRKQQWPGNVRELQHAVERAVILSDGKKLSFDTSPLVHHEREETTSSFNLDEVERETIQKALSKHEGNISRAAKALGLTRTALYRRLEKYGL